MSSPTLNASQRVQPLVYTDTRLTHSSPVRGVSLGPNMIENVSSVEAPYSQLQKLLLILESVIHFVGISNLV